MRLAAHDLEKNYGARTVVKGISLEVSTGAVVGLLGPNGAGKTTIFHIIVGLVTPRRGEVVLDGESITRFPIYKRARKGIGSLPQEPSVFRKLTVEENLLAVLEGMRLSASEKSGRLKRLLEEFNVSHLADHKAYTLSGGECRRVEIARSLVNDPKFLLMDEPFTGIDPIAIIDIQKIVMQLKSKGIGVLITDHNVQETLEITDRAYIINDGKILMEGSSQDIVANPQARSIYLGETFRLPRTASEGHLREGSP